MSALSSGAPSEVPTGRTRRNLPDVSIVVPVFNEESTLRQLRDEVAKALAGESYELVMVNDGSRDARAPFCTSCAADHAGSSSVELARNFGQHPAVWRALIARGRYVRDLDADLQNPPSEIRAS